MFVVLSYDIEFVPSPGNPSCRINSFITTKNVLKCEKNYIQTNRFYRPWFLQTFTDYKVLFDDFVIFIGGAYNNLTVKYFILYQYNYFTGRKNCANSS